jgi:hypothetical protein
VRLARQTAGLRRGAQIEQAVAQAVDFLCSVDPVTAARIRVDTTTAAKPGSTSGRAAGPTGG